MIPKRWQTIEEIFHLALQQEPGKRSSFLQEACGGDESLRKEVESLLQYQTQGESSTEAPAAEWIAKAMGESQARSLIGNALLDCCPFKSGWGSASFHQEIQSLDCFVEFIHFYILRG